MCLLLETWLKSKITKFLEIFNDNTFGFTQDSVFSSFLLISKKTSKSPPLFPPQN